MLRRLLALAAALAMLLGLVMTGAIPVRAQAYSDSIDDMAAGFVDALKSGQTSYTLQTTYKNVDDLFADLFTAYPMLHHYYGSGSYTDYQTHLEVTLELRNTEDSLDELWMVGSDEDLMAVLGLGIAQCLPEIKFVTKDGYVLTDDAFDKAIEKLHYQHHIAYMGYHNRSGSSVGHDAYDVRDYTVWIEYFYDLDAATLNQWRLETQTMVQWLSNTLVAQDMPDYLKVLLVHDWLINNTRYNLANMEEAGNHLAYGALVKGSCVCMGYAEAGLLLFQALGLESYYISGDATNSEGRTESHAWNAVKIDGEWYLVDMTWDDPTSDDGQDYLLYDYFLVNDSQLAKDHTWEAGSAPVCNGTTWNAQRALEAYSQDAGYYTQYGGAQFKTLDQSITEFRQTLTTAAEDFQALQGGTAPEYDPVDTPEDSLVEEPADEGKSQKPVSDSPEGEDGDFGWILIAVVILFVAAVIIYIIRSRRAARRRKRSYVGTGMPGGFGSSGSSGGFGGSGGFGSSGSSGGFGGSGSYGSSGGFGGSGSSGSTGGFSGSGGFGSSGGFGGSGKSGESGSGRKFY